MGRDTAEDKLPAGSMPPKVLIRSITQSCYLIASFAERRLISSLGYATYSLTALSLCWRKLRLVGSRYTSGSAITRKLDESDGNEQLKP